MVEIATSVAAKVAEYLVDPIIRPLGYLFNYRRNITNLYQQIQSLDLERERLQIHVDEANRQGHRIFRGVQEWLTYAEGIIRNRDDFNEAEKKASKSCFYLRSRYRLSKQAKKQATEIFDKIRETQNFGDRVSYRPPSPPPLISAASFKDYEAFPSRRTTFNQIMEAVRNEDISMIGVWGMGGVGKTTLVKLVAKQAEEEKLFHKVVMALNISQTPNILEVQGKIASRLGLTLENNNQRAVQLWKSLKNQEKVLVILDDIWAKLELREIGIPYGDDHKGCKVLLTSRDLRVLDTDMRTQKEFRVPHLNEEDDWSLFKRTAGDSVERPELRPIAVNVVKKCEGLPIAIVTIAKALKNKSSVRVWENALEELRRAAPTNIKGATKGVYSCLELSYNHLEGDEVKSLFLLCALMGDGDISMDRLLQYAMGLNLFKGIYSCERAANKLITLVEILKASSLLLDDEDGGNDKYSNLVFEKSLFFDESMLLRMHDVVRDVARSIASKDPHQFVVQEAVGVQEEWQWMDECRNCTRISLKCKNIDELPQGLVCPKLEFFLLNSSNDDDDDEYEDDDHSYLKIPDAFLQDTKQLRVLDLSKVSLAPSPSSLGFLSNLRTLCLNRCVLQDIAVIGELKKLQVLSLTKSMIEQLPKEMMQLSDLRVLDLRNCYDLKVIPRNVISSLSRLEYLSMERCRNLKWEKEGFNSGERINNACLSELKHLSGLRTLEVEVSDPSLLPEDDVLFDNLNLTRYAIEIGDPIFMSDVDVYKASRRLMLCEVKRLHMVNCSKLLKRSQVLGLQGLNDTKDVVYELDKEGFVELKGLSIEECPSIQYILHSSTSVKWAPPPNTFYMLEQLNLRLLNGLEAVCDGPIPMGFFGNLRILNLSSCNRLKYVFSLPTQHDGRESLAFPQLQELRLEYLKKVISFYSIGRSSGSEESVTFFNEEATFPTLESLHVECLDNVTALWHDQLPADSFPKLRELEIRSCNKLPNIFPSNILKGLQSLQILTISYCRSIQYILRSSTSADWAPPPNTFCMLEKLELVSLDNLEAVCDDPIPMGFFGNLRILGVLCCRRMKYVFSVPSTQHGRESLAFPQLQSLVLYDLPEVISFYSIGRSSGSEESVTFFNQQVAFPALEFLSVRLENVRALWQNQLPADSFSKLKELKINYCNKLLNVFPLSVAKVLVQLEDLEIQSCEVLEAIVANENEAALLILFPKLTSLVLNTLPQLKSFCSGRFTSKWPLLKKLKVHNCDKVEILFQEIGLEGELDNKIQQSLFLVEKEAFPHLEELSLTLKGTTEIWQGQFSRVSSSKLRVLNVTRCHGISVVISSNMVQKLHNLERLEVDTCNSANEVIQVERLSGEEFHVETLPRLTEICLKNLPMLMHLSRSGVYFQNLQTLKINSCGSLINLATPSMAKRLSQLETLIIANCHILKEIVGNEGDEPTNEIDFTRLQRLELAHLPNLESFCSARYTFQFPSLERMNVEGCPKMEFFCKGVLDTPRLKSVYIPYPYIICWEGDLNTTIHKKFMEQGYKEEDPEESDSINSDPREEDFKED